jgi:betaine reductase
LHLRLLDGQDLEPEADGLLKKGVRKNIFRQARGSARAVDMLLAKLAGKEFETEYPMPDFDRVKPNPAIKDIRKAKIALVTSGGIVPKGNPDNIEASSASKYGKYDISGINDLDSATIRDRPWGL